MPIAYNEVRRGRTGRGGRMGGGGGGGARLGPGVLRAFRLQSHQARKNMYSVQH